MFNKILEIIEGDDDENSIFGLLRLIRFDIDPYQKRRPFEKHVTSSNTIQDAKGNPGSVGGFTLSNLRFVWQMRSDAYVNLSCGLQSIVFVEIKTAPVQWGSGYKYTLIVKAQSQSQTRYEFRFVGYNQADLMLFQKLNTIRKQVMNTKSFRCTNLAVKYQNEYEAMEGQQLKAQYNNLIFVQDQKRCGCKLFLTNVRLVIIKQNEKKMNIGIVWLMIKSIQPEQENDQKGVRLVCRGLLAMKQLFLYGPKAQQMRKLQFQLKSFCELYNKAPILGFDVQEQPQTEAPKEKKSVQIQQLQGTKVNLVRRKNAYTSSTGVGNLQNTEFNAELGLMIEKLPEGVTRNDLWQIIKQQ